MMLKKTIITAALIAGGLVASQAYAADGDLSTLKNTNNTSKYFLTIQTGNGCSAKLLKQNGVAYPQGYPLSGSRKNTTSTPAAAIGLVCGYHYPCDATTYAVPVKYDSNNKPINDPAISKVCNPAGAISLGVATINGSAAITVIKNAVVTLVKPTSPFALKVLVGNSKANGDKTDVTPAGGVISIGVS